jgi:hypothetical protein
MRKTNKKVSQHKEKRYFKNLARKKRQSARLDNHVNWLDTLMKAGKDLDMDRLSTYKIISKLTGNEEVVARNPKQTKLIIDKLVSRNAR